MQRNNIKFNYIHIKELFDNNQIDEAKTYLKQFFFRFKTQIFFFNGIQFELRDQKETLKLIPDDLFYKDGKKLITAKSFFSSTEFLNIEYEPTIDFKQSLIFNKVKRIQGEEFPINYLNCAKPHNIDVFISKENIVMMQNDIYYRNKLDLIYNHILKVLSNNDNNLFTYILNFIACSFAGRKLRKALYFQSEERTGKGIIFNGLLNQILGDRMLKTNSIESITKYTKPLEGISLLNLDELPHCDNFKGLQDSLKGLITEPTFTCRDMYTTGYTQVNSFNIIITTNNNAVSLTQNNKERYIICDIDESYKGNSTYFKSIADAVNDENVRALFYHEMMKRYQTLNNWNEDIAPETKFKKTKIIEALPSLYKYLKENFILKNIDLDKKTDVFLEDYQKHTLDKSSKQALGRLLSKINITPIKLSGNAGYKYKKSCEELISEYNKNNWMDDDNDLINPQLRGNLDDGLDLNNESEIMIDYEQLYKNSLQEIEQLKQKLKQVEEPTETLLMKKKVIKKIN